MRISNIWAAARRRVLLAAGAALLATLLAPAVAPAHGLLISKRDLPIPEWLFGWGASLVLIVSFVGLSFAWKQARFEEQNWRPFSGLLSRVLVSRATQVVTGAIGVALLAVVVYTGLNGTEAPDRNFAVIFIFVTVWLGFVAASAILGDVFRAFNPWRAIAMTIAGVFKLVARQAPPAPLRYPEWLGRWPAVAGLVGFAWLELVYGTQGFQAVGLTPHTAAVAVLGYSAITFVGMTLFGINTWLDRGEMFSVYFGMFARLSPLEVRDGRLGRRKLFSGIVGWGDVAGSTALVLFTIGITAFDGSSEGLLNGPINDTFGALQDAGWGPVTALRASYTLYLGLTIAAVCGLYWAGIVGMHTVGTKYSTRELGKLFAHSFIPIALAYLVAHYFTLAVFAEQAQFGYLLSDPLGDGSDLFGTAANGIDYSAVSSEVVWYVQVGALLSGHVLALVLGHDRALKVFGDPRAAARSQYWMLSLMVGFTSLGLFLLSQSNA